MTTTTQVNFDEPATKPPPILVVGPIAWIRKNLFRSWFDTLLTMFTGAVILTVLSSFFAWVVGQANWYVVVFNLRLLILGRFPVDAEWRVLVLAAISAFTIGMLLAIWMRVPRRIALIAVFILVLLFISPPLITALLPVSPSYMAAGTGEIAFGAAAETPQAQVGFIAKAGENVSVRMADSYAVDDQSLGTIVGFTDKAAALVANAASTRLDTASKIASLNAQLASDLLTAGQRARLNTQLSKLEIPPPILDTFKVNRGAIAIRILRGSTLEPIATGTISPGSPAVSVVLPADGWYILEKIPTDKANKGASILEVRGIAPILQRDLTGSTDSSGGARISQYIRVTDSYTTDETRPAPNGKNVPMALLIDNGYRGEHRFSDFLRLYVGPFFDLLKTPLLFLAVALALGYFATGLIDRFTPKTMNGQGQEIRHKLSRRVAVWLLIALPVVMFGLVYGVGNVLPLTDTRRWGGLLLTIILTLVSTIASFPLGVMLALGRRSELPVVQIASTIYIEFVRGVPLITVLFMAQLLLPLVNPTLAEMPNVFRAIIAITLFNAAYLAENVRGGLQSVPYGQQEAAKALGLSSFQITLEITLPQALRAVFPALVGMVISLFKDTSLVAIVGLLDLTGMAENTVTQTEFIGQRRETLLFITLLYFGISYVIASVSRRIERSGSGAVRVQKL